MKAVFAEDAEDAEAAVKVRAFLDVSCPDDEDCAATEMDELNVVPTDETALMRGMAVGVVCPEDSVSVETGVPSLSTQMTMLGSATACVTT